jgi:phosphate transport system protein
MLKELFGIFKEGDLYNKALRSCHEMLDISQRMYNASVVSLRHTNTAEVDLNVYETDQIINAFERDIRRMVMTHLAISGKAELTSGLVLVSIVVDIERIGDYTKNIYDLAIHHPGRLEAGVLEDQISAIENATTDMLAKAIACFKTADSVMARKLMTGYKENISKKCDELTYRLVEGKGAELTCADQVTAALYLRFLKRIGAHSRNMISSVVNPFERIGFPE